MHIEIYNHHGSRCKLARRNKGHSNHIEGNDPTLPGNIRETIEKVGAQADRKLIELGHVADDSAELIELNLMSDAQIAEVNKRLRWVDGPTDVISLRLDDHGEGGEWPDRPRGVLCTGEIYISLERCKAQADEIGHSFAEEFSFLLVHGLLHIFGYDHQTPEEEETMMRLAYEILGRKD